MNMVRTPARAAHGDIVMHSKKAIAACPHCDTPLRIRSSDRVTETFKHLYVQCENVDCGFTAKYSLSPVHQITPSGMPRLGIDIPECPPQYLRSRFAAHVRRAGHDPGEEDQIDMFSTG
jgi:ssDNA-binding Zn-finger/Zn-ribbon topoisomerase 1